MAVTLAAGAVLAELVRRLGGYESLRAAYKFGPGEINVPIAFGGQVVFPGDIVIGDTDGMIFVRPSEAEEILEKSWKQHAKEDMLHAKYDEGATVASYNEETREATLAALGCQVIEGQWK